MILFQSTRECFAFTHIGRYLQKPGVHYALEGGEKLKFGDIEAIYSPVGPKDATGNETLVNISQAPTQIIQRDDEAGNWSLNCLMKVCTYPMILQT